MVKITRETGSTTVEGTEHTLATTWGVKANVTIPKGYVVSQNSSGYATLALGQTSTGGVGPDGVGKLIGVADETVTGSTTDGEKLIRIIQHGLVWATTHAGAIAIGNVLQVSSTAGTLGILNYTVDQPSWIVGTAMTAAASGYAPVLVALRV